MRLCKKKIAVRRTVATLAGALVLFLASGSPPLLAQAGSVTWRFLGLGGKNRSAVTAARSAALCDDRQRAVSERSSH